MARPFFVRLRLLEKLFKLLPCFMGRDAALAAREPARVALPPTREERALALAAFAAIFAVLAARAPALAAVAPVLAAVAAPRAKFTGTLEAPLRYTLIPST